MNVYDSRAMFCPSCGNENTGLAYCNRCGANLTALTTTGQPVQVNLTKPALIVSAAITVFTLGGFGALIGGALTLATVVHGNDPLIAVIFFGMIIILAVDIFLVRQLSKIISASLSSTQQPRLPQPNPIVNRPSVQLAPQTGPRLQGAASVTENTTRFFDPSYPAVSETDELANAPEGKK